MTEVQKVSIGGYAFTLEVEAYAIVKQYLDELNEHYSQLEGGAEVMEGIEERMAELLYEKCADDGVASVDEVNEIIAILGKPSAIESEDDPEPKRYFTQTPGNEKPREKKRLYRDPTGKMLGGVCSGLAAYFKIDVVIIRIIFIALMILGMAIGDHDFGFHISFGGFAVLVYLALWIAMPEAKTVQQRWEMGVTNPPAGGSPKGSDLGRVLRILIGCVLLLIGVAGMSGGLGVIFGEKVFGWDVIQEGMETLDENMAEMMPLVTSSFFKVIALLLFFLPFIGMTYGGIMMVFDLPTPSWRPGLVIFLLWVAALVALVVMACLGFTHTWIW
jgi:Putative stress-responsive transcriptional regulator